MPIGECLPVTDVFGATDRGKRRTKNEDQFLVASLQKSLQVRQTSLADLGVLAGFRSASAHLLVVADGVGGNIGGELASGTTVETLVQHLGEAIGCFYRFDVEEEHAFLAQLQGAVERAHQQVLHQYGAGERGPATTVTMVALVWPRAYIVQVGDSRAYFLREGRLRQITRDQTAYEDVLDLGVSTEEQLEQSGLQNQLRHTLSSAIGARLNPVIGLVDLQAGDVLLLCTDGLNAHVPDDDITGILGTSTSAEESCRRLIDVTLERGARDNVTVIVARFQAP